MRPKVYTSEFVHRTNHERRSFTVHAYNKLDASIEGMKALEKLEGDQWRTTWWEVGVTLDPLYADYRRTMMATTRTRTTKRPAATRATRRVKPATARKAATGKKPKYSAPWRHTIDWVAAGRKAYETRLRNAAAGATPAGGRTRKAVPGAAAKAQTEVTAQKALHFKPRRDASHAAYVTRLTESMTRTAKASGADDQVGQFVGRDMGGGWIVLGTDGHRALTQQGTATNPAPMFKPMTEATPPNAIDLSDELEAALRELRDVNKNHVVELRVDGRKKVVSVTAQHTSGAATRKVPASGTYTAGRFMVDAKYLLDAFGRGGQLKYFVAGDKPLILDIPNDTDPTLPPALRYVVMPYQKR